MARQRSFPLLIPFIAIWIFAVVIAGLAAIGLPDDLVAKLSLVPEAELKVNDGWMILLGWATLFAIFYGVGSICVSTMLFWIRFKKSNHGLESTSAPPAAETLETHP